MKFVTMQLLILLMILPVKAASDSLTPIQLTARQEIADIEELDAAVDQLNNKMRQCAAAGLAPLPECHCRYPRKLALTKTALNRVLNKYPQWQNRAVLWWNTHGTRPSNLHLGGVGTRIGLPCGGTELSSIPSSIPSSRQQDENVRSPARLSSKVLGFN